MKGLVRQVEHFEKPQNDSTYFKMKDKIKRIGLTLGLLSTIISFLFVGRQQGTYLLFLLFGLVVSVVSYLAILFGKGTAKSKLIWTLVLFLAATIQWLTEPILIKSSYLSYLNNNDKELRTVNNILIDKPGDILMITDEIIDKKNLLNQTEKDNLVKLRQKLNVDMIWKSDNRIYYGLWNFLDVQIGIVYCIKNEMPDENYKQLKDNWYH